MNYWKDICWEKRWVLVSGLLTWELIKSTYNSVREIRPSIESGIVPLNWLEERSLNLNNYKQDRIENTKSIFWIPHELRKSIKTEKNIKSNIQ